MTPDAESRAHALADTVKARSQGTRRRDWTVVVSGLGRKSHRDVIVLTDPLGEDFIALADETGTVVARYQRSAIVGMIIEPPEEPQAQR